MKRICMVTMLFALLLLHGTRPGTIWADAVTARQEISAACQHIEVSVGLIDQLAREKKLGEALDMLAALNRTIESDLAPVFYDKVLEVRREEPGYSPPSLSVTLGEAFTTAFWDAKVQQAESSFKNATEALRGASAMRVLDSQDQAFAYLKTAYDTFDSLKSIVEDIATVNLIGLAKDFYDGANGFIDNYKAIEEARLAGIKTELFALEVKSLARRAEKTLELMKDLKSALSVYSDDVLRFQYNLKNIENYTTRAVNDPVFPLDFSNTLYHFDIAPYLTAMDSRKAGFEADDYCWEVFDHLYQKIRQEAATERQQIVDNINASPEPEENKQLYLADVESNWSYFDAYAAGIYTVHADARTAALIQYDALKADLDARKAERNAFIASYWDESGFPQQDLRTFQEETEGILQVNLPGAARPGPYYLGREYAPTFPLGPVVSSSEMPERTPDVVNYSFGDYGGGLLKLAYAYRVMAEAGLRTESALTYANGSPVTTVAVSPLSQGLMDDVAYNLYRLRDQALDFGAFMKGKQNLIDDAMTKQTEVLAAEANLITHVQGVRRYLCEEPSAIEGGISREWSAMITPVLISDWTAGDDTDSVVAAVDGHIGYVQGQNAFNERIQNAGDLLEALQGAAMLNSLIRFIVSDHDSLPAFPSEQGYRDFLTQLNYLHAFYGPASLDHLMDLREESIDLFKQIYGEGLTQWFGTKSPYCLMPGTVERFQTLFSAIGIWSDRHIEAARQGFPGWDAWARTQLAEFWPDANTDDIRPNVIHFTPGRNSENVPLYQVLRIAFNEAIDAGTLGAGAILFEAGGSRRPFTGRYDSALNTFLMNPGRMLPDTTYTVTLTEGLADLAGNPLVPESWSFSTEPVPAGTVPAEIVIDGVEAGGAYAEPVTITISVSPGGYTAALGCNGEPAEPIVSGRTVSLRGAYSLTVTADSGLSRTISFTMGTGTEDYELSIDNEVAAADRPYTVSSDEYVGVGLRYFVDGERYFYTTGGKVYLYDMLTGENRLLFDAGYYYQSEGGVNVAPSTYCTFLGIFKDLVLYCKSTGAEGPGMAIEEKTFSLFVYDLATGRSTRVPTAEGVSLTAGFIRENVVIWIDAHTGTATLYGWQKGEADASSILELSGLESWQVPELSGFDGEWVLYKIGDGNDYAYQYLDEVIGVDYREPLGESLHGIHRITGEKMTLIARDPENPVRIAHAGVSRGLAAFIAYRMHGEVVGEYWEDVCEASWLSLVHLASGISMPLSLKPQIGQGQRFMMSESLVHYVDRTTAPPYSLSGTTWSYELQARVVDLFSYEAVAADMGTYAYKYALFGDRMITDDPAARIVAFGKPISPATIIARSPAPEASDVLPGSTFTVTFSEDMNPDSFTSEWIALSRLDREGNFVERVALEIDYDEGSRTLTLVPATLQSAARYRLYLGGKVEDALGRALVQPQIWYATTADVTGPALISAVPADGSAVMTPGASIRLYFNEKIDPATATQGIQLSQNGTALPFSAAVDYTDDRLLTITPSSPLDYDSLYELSGTPALTDVAGRPLEMSFTLSFRTVGGFTSALEGPVVYSDGMGTVSRIGADGSGQSVIASVAADNVLWSPDESHIYCTGSDLQVMNSDGSGLVTVASGLPWRFMPDFSPDGMRILYAHPHEGTPAYDLVSNSLDGGDPQVLYSVPAGSITSLSWSPDGTRIAFVWFHDYATPVTLGILTVATGQVVFREDLEHPVWSPDGLHLYAQGKIAENGYRRSLVSFSSDLEDSRVVCGLTEIAPAALSPTGRFMAFFMSDGIHVVDCASGTMTHRLVASAADMGPVRLFWTDDETKLLFNALNIAGDWRPGAHVLDLAAGKVATVMAVMGGMPALPMDWQAPSAPGLPLPVSVVLTDLSTPEETRVRLNWEGYSPPAGSLGFHVYRAEAPFRYVTAMTPFATTTDHAFDDTAAEKRRTYYYAVTAVASDGGERTAVAAAGPLVPGDNDGLDDAWEERFWGGLAALPGEDADGDGLSNLQEMQEYTDPTRADTDGDFASDAIELQRGMNPLRPDVLPLQIKSIPSELEMGKSAVLNTTGGSGSYTWSVSDPGRVAIDSEGNCVGLAAGPVTIVAHDTLFTGLNSEPLSINVVLQSFGLLPEAPLVLQKGGRLMLEAVGGSGFFAWQLSDEQMAAMDGSGRTRTLVPLQEAGEFTVTLTDLIRTDLDPMAAGIVIGNVAGDVTGDSRVRLDDVLSLLKILARVQTAGPLYLPADVNGDQRLGTADVLYMLQKVAGTR